MTSPPTVPIRVKPRGDDAEAETVAATPTETATVAADTVAARVGAPVDPGDTEQVLPVEAIAAVEPQLAERYRSLGIATVNGRPRATLGRDAVALPPVGFDDVAEGGVAVGELIAEGGMGEIRSATQRHLRREVAVKRARADGSAEVHQAMLREAWIAGALEHPNILPIHTLSRDGSEPLIVMKRVEGRVWSSVLAEQRRGDTTRRLIEPIGVLIEVCRAVHFAHSRGVLHLDLKPDNVMLGEHGEVVLLDWGIAAAFDGELAPDFIPRANTIEHVCGTLEYVSPEQAMARGSDFGPATDVYLLGAMLHEVITGRPPHRHPEESSLLRSLVSAVRSIRPSFGADVPEELAAIARRALSRDPADRFPTADAFRRALEGFLDHRHALALTAKAELLREELSLGRRSIGVRSSMQALTDEATTEGQLDACRFAYQQALRSWPECEAAREGLAWLASLRLEQAEERLDLEAARVALADHPDPTADLRERFEALQRAVEADAERVRELRALSADESLETDRGVRIRLALTGGTSWSVWNLAAGVLDQTGAVPLTNTVLLTHAVLAFAAFAMVLASVGRRPLTSTAVNRRALTIVLAAFAETFVVWIGAALLGIEAHQAAVLAFGVYVLAGLAVVVVLDARTWWGVALMLLPAFAAARRPEYVFYFTACLGPIGGVGLAYLWRSPTDVDPAGGSGGEAGGSDAAGVNP